MYSLVIYPLLLNTDNNNGKNKYLVPDPTQTLNPVPSVVLFLLYPSPDPSL